LSNDLAVSSLANKVNDRVRREHLPKEGAHDEITSTLRKIFFTAPGWRGTTTTCAAGVHPTRLPASI
jgi:hypothetical protein